MAFSNCILKLGRRPFISSILRVICQKLLTDPFCLCLTGGLWISGGGSKLPGLTKILKEKYSLPVQRTSDLPMSWNGSFHAPEETWAAVSLLCADTN